MNENKNKSITLYDGGGFFLVFMVLGIPAGSILDFVWNLIVLSVTIPFLPDGRKIKTGAWKRLWYTLLITILGLIIDIAYYELTWDFDPGGYSLVWAPTMPQWLQFIWLLLPMVMIFLVNAALSYSLFKLEKKQALILGGVMGFFTAPWVLPIIPYVLGWVV